MELDSGQEVQLHSPNMEHEGFIHSLEFIKGKFTCNKLVTDASSSIRKTIGKNVLLTACTATKYPTIFHSLDVWHKAKKLRKALTNVIIT